MTHPSKSKVQTSAWLKEWFMKERGEDRQWIKKQWHYEPANGKHYIWTSNSARPAKYKYIYISHVGAFRDNHDTFKHRKKIAQRSISKRIIREALGELNGE